MKRKKGYCRICNQFQKLDNDHVPPKGCFNKDITYIYEYFGKKPIGIKYKGYSIQTICHSCNQLLGNHYDPELVRFSKDVMINYYKYKLGQINFHKLIFKYDYKKIMKSIIGHLLAITGYDSDLTTPFDTNQTFTYNKMRDTLLNNNDEYFKNTRILIWIHPYRFIEIQNNFNYGSFSNVKGMLMGSIIKFFPFGFMLLDRHKMDNGFNITLDEININKPDLIIDFSKHLPENYPYNLINTSLSNGVILLNTDHAIKGIKSTTFRNSLIRKLY